MKFTKMQGCGNDYIYVNCFAENVEDRPALARKISDRHFGIGGDGLICIDRSDVADFKMDMYNADGSHGKMCGNGIRCVAKYVYDNGMTDKTELTVETGSGVKTLQLQERRRQGFHGPGVHGRSRVPPRPDPHEGRGGELHHAPH